ncbi:hypothetical protein X772_32535 [Mesorhizobium sp. LSJC280B00]|nr:hypothetical protein X772_32535 [Mesorhizobium sp. LSJC280B00]
MSENNIQGLGDEQMSTHELPNRERRGRRDTGNEPSCEDGDQLGANQSRRSIGQLDQEPQGAGLLFVAEHAYGNKGKQQRNGDVEAAERRNQYAVQRG